MIDSGFEDIEDDKGNLKRYDSLKFNSKKIKLSFEEKLRYYELAGQLLYTFPFTNKRNRSIWELHCAGIAVYRISKELGLAEATVKKVIDSLAEHIVL